MATRPELVVFMGLQASGKSTFYRSTFAHTHTLVSKDLLRNNRRPERRQLELVAAALAAGRPVVVDNTNPTPAERAPLLAVGRDYGASIKGYFFDALIDDCLIRNRQREGRACIPDVALYVTAAKLVVPCYDEGFDQLFQISLRPGAGFVVQSWNEG